MGIGVLEEEAYPSRLENLLNGGEEPLTYEVLNLGVAGFSVAAIVRRVERLGLAFHPDLVVYGFTLNDLEGPGYRHTRRTGGGVDRFKQRWHLLRD